MARRPGRQASGATARKAEPVEDRIVDALMRLVASRSFARIGLVEIAGEAGVSLGELREAFAGKLSILAAFTLVTLHIGLLRDRDGYRLSALNLPTALTLLRVVLVPGIALCMVERHFTLAFVLYLAAALSDVADGWLARRWNQTTRLGTVLDPLVDIVFNLTMFGALAAAGLMPSWVFGVATLRYGILLVGAACFYVFVGPVRIQPTVFGRLTGADRLH